ncbi:MAG: polyphosphate kinase [Alphaproteobacteria bacterium]|nr:polyphosphate kinase [Alphaproteobacteria bacterium]
MAKIGDGRIKLVRQRARLADVDLESRITSETEYENRKRKLQLRMLQIQQGCLLQKKRAVIVMEGWDAAGKGGAIRRLTETLDPRACKVWPIAAPAEDEKGLHFLYRFWRRLPQPGSIAIFDRSWYGRVLVERVEGWASEQDWRRAYREINEFERMLVDDGMPVIKIFFHISADVQLARLKERAETPYKRWKITADDFRNRARWHEYETATDDMLDATWSMAAPWHLVPSNHKWFGRIRTLEIVTEALAGHVDTSPPQLNSELTKLLMRELRQSKKGNKKKKH